MTVRSAGSSALLAVLLATTGCAYYNGMYNAKRWSRRAEGSESAGRTSEARERWQRASLHAESLTARHPRSRWADDAMLVRGRAALHLELYAEAAALLEVAARDAGDPEQRLEALLLFGKAALALRRYDRALPALGAAVLSSSGSRRADALLFRGRSLIAMGATADALVDLRASTHPRARFERARAAVALRDSALVDATLDSLASEHPYRERDWLPLLDSVAIAVARRQSELLVDRLVQRADLSRGERARLLLGDGGRAFAAGDDPAALARFNAVESLVPDSAEGKSAGVRLARIELRASTNAEDVERVRDRLSQLMQEGAAAAREAQPWLRLLDKADSLGRAAEAPDAFWYLRAELLRDSVDAPALAAAAFAAMAERFPDSPWTPKGLIAAIAAGAPEADSLRVLLGGRYAASPYAAAALGRDDDRFAALEDSLQQALAGRPPAGRRVVSSPDASPSAGVDLDEDERVGGRRPATPSQARPAQPRPRAPAQRPPPPPRPQPGARPTR